MESIYRIAHLLIHPNVIVATGMALALTYAFYCELCVQNHRGAYLLGGVALVAYTATADGVIHLW